jgi:MFS family permease
LSAVNGTPSPSRDHVSLFGILGIGQVIGGLLSFAFQHVTSTSFQGWRMMFVVLGCVTVVLGVAAFFLIPDSPSTAAFLTEAEKAKIVQHVGYDTKGAVSSRFNSKQIMDALTDPQLLLLSLMTILVRKQKSSLILPTLTLYHSPAYLPVSSVHTQQH